VARAGPIQHDAKLAPPRRIDHSATRVMLMRQPTMNPRTDRARRRALTLMGAALCASAWALDGRADTLRVVSSGGFAPALRALAAQFELRSGLTLVLGGGPSMGQTPDAIPHRLERGEPWDVVVMVRDALDKQARAGRIDPASEVAVARSLVAAAVRAGAPRPDISTVEALKDTLLTARSIAYSDSASGVYLSEVLFERLGVTQAIAATAHRIAAEPVGQVVARGEVQLGFQQLSELQAVPGIDIVGLLPPAVQQVTEYAAGVVAGSSRAAAARDFIEFLASVEAAEAIRRTGLQPTADPLR